MSSPASLSRKAAKQAEHSPTPWRLKIASKPVDGELDCGIVAIIDGAPYIIAETFGAVSLTVRPNSEANAGFIINAVNNYDALIEAMELIADWRTCNISGEYEHSLRDIIRSMTDIAAAALDKVSDARPVHTNMARGG